jgi:thiamine biosynthesis lipoprotein
MRIFMLFLLAFVFGPGPVATAGEPQRFEFSRIVMGVSARVVFYAADEQAADTAANRVYDRLNALDAVMSDYRTDSELMRLCRAEAGVPHPVSADLAFILARSLEVAAGTDGAFDPTVGPVVRLWRAARRTGVRPGDTELASARALVGYRLMTVDEAERTVTLARPGMQLDLGGIGKGWAADEAIEVLESLGITSALVDLGGDLTASGPPPGREGWTVTIDDGLGPAATPAGPNAEPAPPPKPAGPETGTITLARAAVATSGDLEQHVVIDGVRYSHIIDPRTGEPLTTMAAATVRAKTGLLADALASAACVLGETARTLEDTFDGVRVRVRTGR